MRRELRTLILKINSLGEATQGYNTVMSNHPRPEHRPRVRSSMGPWCVLLITALTLVFTGGLAQADSIDEIDQLISSGKFEAALARARQTVQEAETANDLPVLAKALLRESDAQYYLGDREATLPPLERALTIYESLGDPAGIGRILYSIAYYYERTDSRTMISYLERGLEYAEQASDDKLRMNIANAMGNAQWNLGNYEQAIAAYNESAALALETDNSAARAASLQNIGMIHVHLGENRVALEYLNLALEEFEAANRPHSLAVVLGNAGNAHLGLRNYEAALSCYERSLALHQETGHRRGEGIQLANISTIHQLMNEPDEALPLEEAAHTIAIETGDDRSVIRTRSSLGRIHLELGHDTEAGQSLMEAVALADTFGDPYLLLGPEKALARLALVQQDTVNAFRWADRAEQHARQVNDSYTLATILAIQGQLHALSGRLEKAKVLYQAAIDLHEQTHSRTHRYHWYAELATLSIKQGDHEQARQNFDLSLSSIADLDALIAMDRFRVHLFSEVTEIINAYALWLGQRGETRQGLEVLDWGRARELTMRVLQETSESDFSPDELAALDQLSTFQRRVREEELTDEDRRALNGEIARAEDEYDRARRTRPGPARITNLPQLILPPPTTMAIEYAQHEDTLLVFCAYQGRVSFRLIPNATDLMSRITAYRSLVSNPAMGIRHTTAGAHLFSLLLAPEFLNGAPSDLILIPCGQLWSLPFATLTSGPDTCVIEGTILSYAPSLHSLPGLQNPGTPPRPGILALANGNFTETHNSLAPLAQLEAVTQEAHLVGRLAPEARFMLEADEASIKAMPLDQYQLIHWATHTLVDVEHPARSSIVVGSDGVEDGYLQAREIYRLPLNARLVVVSGCSSGQGPVVAGEGLLGLSHALLSAGAGATLLSRWDVSDEAAAAFMTEYYRALQHHAVAPALQITQQALRHSDRWNHSSVWAAFFVAGDGQQRLDLPQPWARYWPWIIGGLMGAVLLGLVVFGRKKDSEVSR